MIVSFGYHHRASRYDPATGLKDVPDLVCDVRHLRDPLATVSGLLLDLLAAQRAGDHDRMRPTVPPRVPHPTHRSRT